MTNEYISLVTGAMALAVLAYPFARLVNFATNIIKQL
jgi:hypothetical protein